MSETSGASDLDARPLSGLRVLDLSRLLPGPFATMMLADLGAAVDKVEDAGAGDYLRAMPPHLGSMGAAFHFLNRGKRSATRSSGCCRATTCSWRASGPA